MVKKLLKTFIISLALLAFAPNALAATLNISLTKDNFAIGESFDAVILIDSQGVSINASQTTLQYPTDILEVSSVSKADSIFNFWLTEPTFSNTTGRLNFTAGSASGFSGSSLNILKITFKAKGIGTANVGFTDGAVTLSDGSGTNVLSEMKSAKINVLAKGAVPTVSIIPSPTQINRSATPAAGAPIKPVITVPMYPSPEKWYNLSSVFLVSWKLPSDITGVATLIDKDPNSRPTASEGLFDNKLFAPLENGIWYLHVRFQNSIGWGSTMHYRLAIDTQPPSGFEISVLEGDITDNPKPTLQFKTSDALSGLKEYQVRTTDGTFIQIPAKDFTDSFQLPLQAPGRRMILVKAVDLAENSAESSIYIETLPIASPIITLITNELFSDQQRGLTVRGTTLPNISVLLRVQKLLGKERGEIVTKGTASSNENGNWDFTFDQPLRNGQYVVLAESQDERGALSLAIESQEILVKSKPIIQIGIFQLGMGGALIFLLMVIAGGFGGGIWFYKKRQGRLTLRVDFAESEITKIFKIIKEDAEGLYQAFKTVTTGDDEYALKRLRENIARMEGYLKKGIEKIKK